MNNNNNLRIRDDSFGGTTESDLQVYNSTKRKHHIIPENKSHEPMLVDSSEKKYNQVSHIQEQVNDHSSAGWEGSPGRGSSEAMTAIPKRQMTRFQHYQPKQLSSQMRNSSMGSEMFSMCNTTV